MVSLNGISTFAGYFVPKLFGQKNMAWRIKGVQKNLKSKRCRPSGKLYCQYKNIRNLKVKNDC